MDVVDGAGVCRRASGVQLTAVELKPHRIGLACDTRCWVDAHFLCHNGRVKDEGLIILRYRAGGEGLQQEIPSARDKARLYMHCCGVNWANAKQCNANYVRF